MTTDNKDLYAKLQAVLLEHTKEQRAQGVPNRDILLDFIATFAQITGKLLGGIVPVNSLPEAIERLYPLLLRSALEGNVTAAEVRAETQAEQVIAKAAQ